MAMAPFIQSMSTIKPICFSKEDFQKPLCGYTVGPYEPAVNQVSDTVLADSTRNSMQTLNGFVKDGWLNKNVLNIENILKNM